MESLSDETWDVVIVGTSIPQSLLALSLSRSGKKVLHIDHHGYYGGVDAGLSLQDAEKWVREIRESTSTIFHDASIAEPREHDPRPAQPLSPSRSYTLSLNPQIIYAQSAFLPNLVSSRVHTQLEFLAVGSWWIFRNMQLHKIPSTREDVFNDESLSMKDKRGLMRFLRYVLQEEEGVAPDQEAADTGISLKTAMSSKFKIPESLQAPLLALALAPVNADAMPFHKALSRIRRHMISMGYFGQGFGAVIPKYGGNSEIAQVACRAQAVGGGIYLLGCGLKSLALDQLKDEDGALVECTLSDDTRVQTRYVAGDLDNMFSREDDATEQQLTINTWRSVSVVAHPLSLLFPATSENGPNPGAAIVLVDDNGDSGNNPIYLQIHSEDTGESPSGQCIIYASVLSADPLAKGRLEQAVSTFLGSINAKDTILWSLSYRVSGPTFDATPNLHSSKKPSSQVLLFPRKPHDIAFDDSVLDTVKHAWNTILGDDAPADSSFLRFEERELENDG